MDLQNVKYSIQRVHSSVPLNSFHYFPTEAPARLLKRPVNQLHLFYITPPNILNPLNVRC